MTLLNRMVQVLAISLLIPLSAQADSWSCRNGSLVREVRIEQSTTAPVPCNVVYRKLTEGSEDQVLWNAQRDDSYCAEKARGFIKKLASWGWICVVTIREDTISG
jgi:hypothetical protein